MRRAAETAAIAFASTGIPVLYDWRLRECDYGELNGRSVSEVHADRRRWLDLPYPGGESWHQAVARAVGSLRDISKRWDGGRVLVIGHLATRLALEHHVNGIPLGVLIDDEFPWQPGWEYVLR